MGARVGALGRREVGATGAGLHQCSGRMLCPVPAIRGVSSGASGLVPALASLMLLALAAAGCIGSDQETCSWGMLCPSGTVCHDPTHTCQRPAQIGACRNTAEDEACFYPGSPVGALCQRGVCVVPRCGDGIAGLSEVCDDGNTSDCDGCSGDCLAVETGCGDGSVCGSEACDDGNTSDCDGCRGDCSAVETGCGDGFVCGGEACDGSNAGGQTCETLGHASGVLGACQVDCSGFDMGGCPAATALTWVSIPGGTFQMGSTAGGTEEQPVHAVTVPDFDLTQTEVTVAQYGECVTAGACTAPNTGAYCNWSDPGYEDHPVNCVGWQQSVDFCDWASGRLPSEAEWEYAARSGGQDITYPWGNDPATCSYAVMNDEGGSDCGTGRTMGVCSKPAGSTGQGLCDMAGNVWEWVQDLWHDTYTGAPTDGSAWESPSGSHRVIRGGCFVFVADFLRAAFRYFDDPSVQSDYLGFRCARLTGP